MILSENYLLRKIEDAYILFPIGQKVEQGEKTYRLNESGYTILSRLVEEKSFQELFEILADIYQVQKEEQREFREMLESCVSDFIKAGIVINCN